MRLYLYANVVLQVVFKNIRSENTVLTFSFNKKDLIARRALKAGFFFRSLGKFSDKMFMLESPHGKILGIYFATCSTVFKFNLQLKIWYKFLVKLANLVAINVLFF